MPTRRLVVALTVLLLGVFGVGLVTALGRVGDDGGTPNAQPSASQPPVTTTPPSTEPTSEPPTDTPTESPTPEPTKTPAGGPSGTPTGTPAPGGNGGVPNMPNTGAPFAVVVAATAVAGSAAVVRRVLAR